MLEQVRDFILPTFIQYFRGCTFNYRLISCSGRFALRLLFMRIRRESYSSSSMSLFRLSNLSQVSSSNFPSAINIYDEQQTRRSLVRSPDRSMVPYHFLSAENSVNSL